MRRKAGLPLSPEIVFTEELEKYIGKNNLGILVRNVILHLLYAEKILVNKILKYF